jgi:cell division protein ZapA (FtsZ GTPase activity inhibitor)
MDARDSSLHTTRVEIGNDRFQIQTDLTDAELSAIVSYVTKKVDTYVKSDARMDMRKQMLLMAMDITSELFDMRRRHARYKEFYQESQKVSKVLAEMISDELGKLESSSHPDK